MITFNMLGRAGRLGNQLFQIAATIGVARRNGTDYAFPPWPYAEYFTGPLPQTLLAALNFPTMIANTFAFCAIDVAMSVNLWGYFQTEKYFRHCAGEVRQILKPRSDIEAAVGAWLDKQRRLFGGHTARPVCAVHVRRGDYVGNGHYVDLAESPYYENAFRHFADDTIFAVVSDDIPWCKFRFRDRPMIFVEGGDVQCLILMSLCDAIIIANSSYSWWGAWLTDRPGRPVIAPNRWFDGDHADPRIPYNPFALCGCHDASDLIPDRWRLEATGP